MSINITPSQGAPLSPPACAELCASLEATLIASALSRGGRKALELHIERMIAALDVIDGDPDAEPALGSLVAGWIGTQERWADGVNDEREQDIGDEPHDGDIDLAELDRCDEEPSLGWPEGWQGGGGDTQDLEDPGHAHKPRRRALRAPGRDDWRGSERSGRAEARRLLERAPARSTVSVPVLR